MKSAVASFSLVSWILADVLILTCFASEPASGFSSTSTGRPRFCGATWMAQGNSNGNTHEEEPFLNELDARVLQSMLRENDKLDLQQEANMKKLLERAVAPKTPEKPVDSKSTDSNDGPYSSTLFKVRQTRQEAGSPQLIGLVF
jgi:hypothetical protein